MKFYDLCDEQFIQTFVITRHARSADDCFYSITIMHDFIDDKGAMIRQDESFGVECRTIYEDLVSSYIDIMKMINSPLIGFGWSSSCLLRDCETDEEIWFEINESSISSVSELEKQFATQVNNAKSKPARTDKIVAESDSIYLQ